MTLSEKNYDEATDWLARLRASDVSDRDHENFALWLMQDTANKPAFDAMLGIWEDLGVVNRLDPSDFYESQPDSTPAVASSAVPLQKHYAPIALAATLVFALATLFLIQYSQLEYSTGAGQFELVILEDGSQVKLNSRSRIAVIYSSEQRLIRLEAGEAFFDVTKDAQRPFIVENGNNTIHAVGTSFGVWDTGNETRVTVTEGLVKVSNAEKSIAINANQQARVSETSISVADIDAIAVTAWRDGRLEYDGVTLAELIDDMNRYMPRRVTIGESDDELTTHRVSGIIEISDQDTMLLALQESLIIPIEIEFSSDNRIVITRTN